MTSRHQFMMTIVPACAALSALGAAHAADAPKVDEKDPAAVGLGYKADATKVDAKNYPTYKAGNVCGGCQFFQGKAGDAWGPCPLLGGKQVSAKGWCSAWAKKA